MGDGLLVMAYGSPGSAEDIEAYYTHIRRGRRPTREQLADLVRRYEAIGGTTALAERTAEQLRAIELAVTRGKADWVVRLATLHSTPAITQSVASLVGSGVERIVGLVLAPHYCAASVGEYHRQAISALEDVDGVTYHRIDSWHLLDALIGFQADQVRACLDELPERTRVVFTAHSLPQRVLAGDPYPQQLRDSASAIAGRAGIASADRWSIGWQSAGATPEPWLGPDLAEVIAEVASTRRYEGILVVPQGFTSAHLEVLYDVDIEAAALARRVGLAFGRTQMVNDEPAVMAALASLVRTTVEQAGSGVGDVDGELA